MLAEGAARVANVLIIYVSKYCLVAQLKPIEMFIELGHAKQKSGGGMEGGRETVSTVGGPASTTGGFGLCGSLLHHHALRSDFFNRFPLVSLPPKIAFETWPNIKKCFSSSETQSRINVTRAGHLQRGSPGGPPAGWGLLISREGVGVAAPSRNKVHFVGVQCADI